jgi:hypothetical protein
MTIGYIRICALGALMAVSSIAGSLSAQITRGARERQEDRIERRTERRLNRTDGGFYFNDANWAELSPWVQQYQFAPIVTSRPIETKTYFGFDTRNKDDDWYYDYYDYGVGGYYPSEPKTAWSGYGYYWYDNDHDGVYDVYYDIYDKDRDGIADELEHYRLGEAQTSRRETDQADDRNDSDEWRAPPSADSLDLQGEIIAVKKGSVRGSDYMVVHVQKSDGGTVAVDLGPADQLKVNVNVGDAISARGHMANVGDKQVLVAVHFEVNKEAIDVQRQGQPFKGKIVETRTVSVRDEDHVLVVLDVDGKNHLIDVGPQANLQVELAPKTELTVYGVPVDVRGTQVLMANQLEYKDRRLPIARRVIRQ